MDGQQGSQQQPYNRIVQRAVAAYKEMAGDILYDMQNDLAVLKRDLWEKNLLLHRVSLAKSLGGNINHGVQV